MVAIVKVSIPNRDLDKLQLCYKSDWARMRRVSIPNRDLDKLQHVYRKSGEDARRFQSLIGI